jgi:hypothetical protein
VRKSTLKAFERFIKNQRKLLGKKKTPKEISKRRRAIDGFGE